MMTRTTFSTFLLAAALACAPAMAAGRQNNSSTAGQDMRNAGHDTKDAARNAGHATKKGTKKAYNKTKSGTKKAYNKTKNTTKGAVEGGKQGAQQPQ